MLQETCRCLSRGLSPFQTLLVPQQHLPGDEGWHSWWHLASRWHPTQLAAPGTTGCSCRAGGTWHSWWHLAQRGALCSIVLTQEHLCLLAGPCSHDLPPASLLPHLACATPAGSAASPLLFSPMLLIGNKMSNDYFLLKPVVLFVCSFLFLFFNSPFLLSVGIAMI